MKKITLFFLITIKVNISMNYNYEDDNFMNDYIFINGKKIDAKNTENQQKNVNINTSIYEEIAYHSSNNNHEYEYNGNYSQQYQQENQQYQQHQIYGQQYNTQQENQQQQSYLDISQNENIPYFSINNDQQHQIYGQQDNKQNEYNNLNYSQQYQQEDQQQESYLYISQNENIPYFSINNDQQHQIYGQQDNLNFTQEDQQYQQENEQYQIYGQQDNKQNEYNNLNYSQDKTQEDQTTQQYQQQYQQQENQQHQIYQSDNLENQEQNKQNYIKPEDNNQPINPSDLNIELMALSLKENEKKKTFLSKKIILVSLIVFSLVFIFIGYTFFSKIEGNNEYQVDNFYKEINKVNLL